MLQLATQIGDISFWPFIEQDSNCKIQRTEGLAIVDIKSFSVLAFYGRLLNRIIWNFFVNLFCLFLFIPSTSSWWLALIFPDFFSQPLFYFYFFIFYLLFVFFGFNNVDFLERLRWKSWNCHHTRQINIFPRLKVLPKFYFFNKNHKKLILILMIFTFTTITDLFFQKVAAVCPQPL